MGSGGHRINTHYDESENFYFVLIGSKEFQLFPPEQSRNLYPGPLHGGHGGVTESLVDPWNPDARAFPRFSEAEDHSVRYRLSAGDMLYLPRRWWHNVASAGINFSANYWWNDVTPRDPCDA
jgi:ribosomal protein L16 Arg81 hydroxylase